MKTDFADLALDAVEKKNSVVVVGLDPVPERFPPVAQPTDATPKTVAASIAAFCCNIIEATLDSAIAVKPQIAFFERWGPPGLEALAEVVACAAAKALLVILDAKRGDIGSTAEAYAAAYLDPAGMGSHIHGITVNPYLGADSVEPFLRRARDDGKGVFLLVRTSNPSAAQVQDLCLGDGRPVYEAVAELVRDWSAQAVAPSGYSNVGAVVGATWPEQLRRVRSILPRHWFLLPGYGTQGAGPLDVVTGLDNNGFGLLVNASRSIIYAWEKQQESDPRGQGYASAARTAAEKMRRAIAEAASGTAPSTSGGKAAP